MNLRRLILDGRRTVRSRISTRRGCIFGSNSKTSRATRATCPDSRASTRACSCTTAPREVLTMRTPGFVSARAGRGLVSDFCGCSNCRRTIFVQQMPGVLGQRTVYRENIGPLENFFERDVFRAGFILRGQSRPIIVNHFHAYIMDVNLHLRRKLGNGIAPKCCMWSFTSCPMLPIPIMPSVLFLASMARKEGSCQRPSRASFSR